MWKLAIVFWATAAFFASTQAQSPSMIPDIHHENVSTSTTESLLNETVNDITNRALEMVKNRYIEVYGEILNLGPLDPKTTMAITSKYTTKLESHLQLIKSFVDDMILSRAGHASFDEEECRSFHSSYNDLMTDLILNATKTAPSQAFHEVSLEFTRIWVKVNENLRGLPERLLSDPKFTIQSIHNRSAKYCRNFNSDADQFLIQYEKMINGTAIEEIVRREWDLWFIAVPDVIGITHECVTRSRQSDESVPPTVVL